MHPLVMPPAALGASWCRNGGVSSSGYSLGGEKTERGLLLLQVITLLLPAFLFVGLVSPPELGSLGGAGESCGAPRRGEQEGKSLVRSYMAAASFS